MKTVQLSVEQRATLTKNLSKDKKFINAQRKEAKRQRDEQRRRQRAEKAAKMIAELSAPTPTENPHLMRCIAACIDRMPVKVGKTWIR